MKKGLKIIIPVAGVGTRLRPHTYAVPKPLMPVAGKPVLQHLVDPLLTLAPEELVFVVGHLGDQHKGHVAGNASKNQRRLCGLARKRFPHRETRDLALRVRSME
mgnify:CR=1 FL=1